MAAIPLDPGRGGMCVAPSVLRPADIIVSTTSALVSGAIRTGTRSAVSHAILYAGDGMVIEAIGDGVVRRLLSVALADARLAVAYRRAGVTPGVAGAVVAHAAAAIGRKYDASGALGAGIASNPGSCVVALGITACAVAVPAARAGAFNQTDRFFCSELVLEAFRLAGLPLATVPPHLGTPQTLVEAYSRGVLQYVGHLKA